MRRRLGVLLLACVAGVAAAAQRPQPASPPTFRAGANYVRVDMYATRDGRPLDDLTPADIDLREDGVPQKIEAFEFVRVRTATPEAARIEPNTVAESRQMAADARARVFVIFVDTYNTTFEGSASVRNPLARFLDRVLGPDDLVAVMTPQMSARDLAFARKTTLLIQMLDSNSTWGTKGRQNPTDDREEEYALCYPNRNPVGRPDRTAAEMIARRREMLTLDAVDDLVTVLGGLREERKAVLTVSEGWMQYGPDPSLAAATKDLDGQPTLPPPDIFGRGLKPGGRDDGYASTMARCEQDRLTLSMLDDRERVRQIGERANRANVSFYPVDPRGLVVFDSPIGPDAPPSPQQDAPTQSTKLNSLRMLADTTDGLAVVNTNMIDRGIDRIVSDLSSYYLLGYYSTNARLDGKFRTISVRVTRPGVDVRARRGYRALTAAEAAPPKTNSAPATAGGDAPKSLGGVVVNPRAPFRLRASSWVASTSGTASVARFWIVGELDSRTRKELAWTSGAHADITVVGPDGAPVETSSLDVPASDASFTLRVPESGNVKPGDYSVRVRLRPQADASLPLSDTARVQVPAKPEAIGEPILWRRGPSTGTRYVVTADPRFLRTERLRLEFATRTTMPATAKLIDRSGRPMEIPVQMTERADAGSDFHWIVADLTLAPLAAGDYAIEVTADGATRLTEFRVVP
jgi:VWFA-related protein